MNNTIKTLYTLLNIKGKIEDQPLRLLYLKDVWGLDQKAIADLESLSQPNVSRYISKARKEKSAKNIILSFSEEELKFVQSLPREIINDIQLIAFYNNVLKLKISHPFFITATDNDALRIAALSALGIMNKRLEQIFNKSQASVSMILKRTGDKHMKIERALRFDTDSTVYEIEKIEPKVKSSNKFILAGGHGE